ncbi:MAG TPA: hypothetical protein VIP52_01785 [Candidatus Dormibacteraeota bacterium]
MEVTPPREVNIKPGSRAADHSPRAIAFVLPLLPGKEAELDSFAKQVESRRSEYDEYRRELGITREAAFLQTTAQGGLVVAYRELDSSIPVQPSRASSFAEWWADRMSALHGFDPATPGQPQVELLIRQRPPRQGRLHASASPLLPNKSGRLQEWSSELDGIHSAEFEESLRRLGHGLTIFVQHTPQVDLVITVVEGAAPAGALAGLATSNHPFDRWQIQQIADQTGLDFADPSTAPNRPLWSSADVAVSAT